MTILRVGEIPYANVWPLYRFLRDEEDCTRYRFVPGVPTQLNRLLRTGEIDVSPSSSVEYLLHQDMYEYLPGLSVSSRGPIRSILLLAKRDLLNLDGRSVALTDQSASSVLLARVLLEDFRGIKPRYTRVSGSPRNVLASHDAYLVIGDDALLAGLRPGDWKSYDLGQLWWQDTGLPFVFALWIVRKAILEDTHSLPLIQQLTHALEQAKRACIGYLKDYAPRAPQAAWYPEGRLVEYWKLMSYDLDEDHLRGMAYFLERVQGLSETSLNP